LRRVPFRIASSLEMDMQTVIAIVCLALSLWVAPASAQQVHSLKVSIHKDVQQLTEAQTDQALERASRLLNEARNQCGVTLKRSGPIETFDSAPKKVTNLDELEAVHSVPADLKIVESIKFCMGRYDKKGWWGCAWRPEGRPKTVIVVRGVAPGPVVGRDTRFLLWAHEFGHTKGLHHRLGDERALMTPCALTNLTRRITNDECSCFKDSPLGCPIPPPKTEPTRPVRRR